MKALEINNLNKTYPNGFIALKNINLQVKQGDFFALLGPNGAGKSTIISILSTLIQKTSGTVKVFGADLDNNKTELKKAIGVVPQDFNFNQFEKVLDILIIQAGYYGINASEAKKRAQYYLTALDLWDKHKNISRALSGGMKRRLMIARALMHNPKLLILDEPTAGVDIEMRHSLWKFLLELNQQGLSIILTTHYLEEAEQLCKNIAIINHGSIVENTSMKDLLHKLPTETFILDIKNPITKLPILSDYVVNLLDQTTLEVQVDKKTSINELFAKLSAENIEIISLRNKSNRLEQLFLTLTA